jgi:two-component system, chemotaxis family, CheB/CheR fusion protein
MGEQEFREHTDEASQAVEQSSEAIESAFDEDVDWHHPEGGDTPQSIGVFIEASATVEWNEENQNAALPYPVVGIGASAGGLQAFRELLEGLPEKTGMAYVIISHLAADQRSYLTEILARHTSMHVQTIEEGLQPQPDNLYVLPPGQIAFIEKGSFRVEFRDVAERLHYPVDDFFRSPAADQKSYSIGVILSGADGDGTLGVKAIKGEGGLSLAQSPETAEHSSMPLSSIEMDHVDFVASPKDIGAELGRLGHLFAMP